jgi:hypothetical protein
MSVSGLWVGVLSAACTVAGLVLVRWLPRSGRNRGLFTMGAAGVALFVVIEVGHQALGSVELGALSDAPGSFMLSGLRCSPGLLFGLVGLAWIETRRTAGPMRQAVDVAVMLAGASARLPEGLSVGQSMASLAGPGGSWCLAWRSTASWTAPPSRLRWSDSRAATRVLLLAASRRTEPARHHRGHRVGGTGQLLVSVAAGTLIYVCATARAAPAVGAVLGVGAGRQDVARSRYGLVQAGTVTAGCARALEG